MKKNPYALPESFGLSPLLDVLPVEGDLRRLANAHDSLYARLERVRELRAAGFDAGSDSSLTQIEESMLQLIVNWISDDLAAR